MKSLLRHSTALPDEIAELKSSNNFRYEIVNLTSYGGDTGFPILTGATLWGLRLVHRYASGVNVEIPLYDSSGTRQIDLDNDGVYLRSDPVALADRRELVEIVLTGHIRPTRLETSRSSGRKHGTIDVCSAFSLETIVVPGLYETINITGVDGNRYPIGTLGILADELPAPDTFAKLRRSAGRSILRGRPIARVRRIAR